MLRLELAVDGARATTAGDGIALVLDGSGRTLAYSRLHVSDASGRTLTAHLEATAANRITIVVDDTNARWPLRIDPTFSDADWFSMGLGQSGPNGARPCPGGDRQRPLRRRGIHHGGRERQ